MPEPAPPGGSSVYPLVTVAFLTVVFPAVPDTVPARIIASLWSLLPDPPLKQKTDFASAVEHSCLVRNSSLPGGIPTTCFQKLPTMTEEKIILPGAGRTRRRTPRPAGRFLRPPGRGEILVRPGRDLGAHVHRAPQR